jgi:hypothetical protein
MRLCVPSRGGKESRHIRLIVVAVESELVVTAVVLIGIAH